MLSRAQVKAHLVADMTVRFPAMNGKFPESLKLSTLPFPSAESRREWGKQLNNASWYTGWFTPSEFLACVTLGRDPKNDPANKNKNLIDLMYSTQNRAQEQNKLAELSVGGARAKAQRATRSTTRRPPKKIAKSTKSSRKGSKNG